MPNWLELADAEFLKTCDRGSAKSAKSHAEFLKVSGRASAKSAKTQVSAVSAAPHPDIFEKKEMATEQAKLEAHRDFPGRTDNKELSCDVEAGDIVAVLIASEILNADIWLAFRDDFDPQDGKAIFYAHELPLLRSKTAQQLREIHKTKLTFGAGSKVRQ